MKKQKKTTQKKQVKTAQGKNNGLSQTVSKTVAGEAHNLHALAEKYGTDKLSHGYIDEYAKLLLPTDPPRTMLEIGVHEGRSLKMWREYFATSHIEALDNYSYDNMIDRSELEKLGIKVHVGNEDDIGFLSNNIKGEFDIILQDGSHIDSQRSVSFRHLFVNNLKSGGIFFIEDLNTSSDPGWNPGGEETNLLEAFKKFMTVNNFASKLFPDNEAHYWQSTIAKVELLVNDKLVAITKK